MTGKSEENGNKIEFDTIFVGNKQADWKTLCFGFYLKKTCMIKRNHLDEMLTTDKDVCFVI